MPGINSSLPEEQDDEPAQPTTESGLSHGEFASTLAHDARTPLQNVAFALDIVGLGLGSDDPLRSEIEKGKKNVKTLSSMLKEAVGREPLPEYSLENIQEKLRGVLEEMCTNDLHLSGKCKLECGGDAPLDSKSEQVEVQAPGTGPLRVVLLPLPDELARDKIPCSQSALQRIFDNLIKNSLRKGAKTMSINISRGGYHEVIMTISDDGEGMKLQILRNLRKGISDTDKTEDDGIEPGQEKSDHGRGVEAIRKIVMERSGGTMQIFSIKKDGLPDPDGDMQDEQSIGEHPYEHGVTYRFSYKVKNVEPNGDYKIENASAVDEPVVSAAADVPRHTRRQLLRIVAGGAAAASLGGIGYAVLKNSQSEEIVQEEFPVSPLSHIVIDDEGGLVSFQLQAGDKSTMYERDRPLPDAFQDVRTIPIKGGSVSVIDPSSVEDMQLRRMFVCAVPEGIFGYVDITHERSQQMGYLCATHDDEEEGADNPRPFLLTDTIFNTRLDPAILGVQQSEKVQSKNTFDATSADMLRSPAFDAMHTSLQGVANLLTRQSQFTGGASFNIVRPVLIKALNAHHALRNNGVSAKSLRELQQHMAGNNRFIVADRSVVQTLRRVPLPPEESQKARDHGNSLCLPGVSPTEAQAMIRLV